MLKIPTKIHAAGDIATGALLLAAPKVLPMRDRRAQALAGAAGAGTLVLSAFTDYELGVRRRLPVPVHLLVDALTGGLLIAAGLGLRTQRGTKLGDWLPPALVGAGEIAAAGLTERPPARRSAPGAVAAPPADVAAAAVPLAPAPVDAPGPSVTPPAQPESDVERAERIDAQMAGAGSPQTGDTLVAQQEAAAAAEAAAIGGAVPQDVDDPALQPVYQAGGGEQEGWEAAEADLVENATHGDGHGHPERDALPPEAESDRATAAYGETDRLPSTEVVTDPETSGEEPEAGRGRAVDLTADR